ncbi:hypothetical protein niasHT_004497 [Heterodera trifolii]|uniref:Integrase catalytic domain-containing protein n=1 Tax=Heterodera trifolii TaxID=157864 RepID=A0ABD2MET5_9BILA
MSTISTAMTIEKLRYLASRHGIPETLVSDNGTQFKSSEFAKFTAANGINHLFSAPYHPMSNGQAERFVDTFKRAFRKLKGERMSSVKEIIETFLITYRTTPNDSLPDSKSPAEMLIGRKPRTTLDLLKPPPIQPIERDQAMEKKFNRRFGTRPQIFASKDAVWARHRLSQSWKAGTICGCSGVIYNVRFEDGSSGRYHANQLRLRKATQNVEDPLNILNEEFNLPIQMAPMVNGQQNGQVLENRPDSVNAEDEVEEPPIRDEQQDAIQAVRSPMPQRRYPDRRRQHLCDSRPVDHLKGEVFGWSTPRDESSQ